ncbi:winged helix-turn-helix transcriptional regulator [Streptacidiphilus albus]|uniref:winged helix-turn-helix transcriptional regulator n=1 Tax=Streptacidiphilus albus TaxID=105425 RepID=UPI0005A9A2DB|nr:helix-turn-helix domain-containing protein [Streptacidiphilus albus]
MTVESDTTGRIGSLANEVFTGIATKWALLIIDALGAETLRFNQLRAQVEGISHKMLAQTLRTLERDGIVDRTAYATVPPRVDYNLTAAGRELQATIHGICQWTHHHLDHIQAARDRFDGRVQ